MKFGSVCSGIEAASCAWHPLGWETQFVSEIEPFPSAVLNHHYPSVPNLGDMTKYKEWPDATLDVLVGGTPCQSFSIAGLRKGLADPRGNLMLTFGAIADKYKPTWLVWENVPGCLSSDRGRDFGAFLGLLGELRYGYAYRVLDAQYVRVDSHRRAVPQRRRRVFVVGYLGDWRPPAAVLFEPESLSGNTKPSRKAGERVAPTVTNGPPFSRTGNEYVEAEAMVTVPTHDVVGALSDGAHNGGGLNGQDAYTGRIMPVCIHGTQDPDISIETAHPLGRNSGQENAVFGIPGNWIGRKPENGGNAVEPMHGVSPNLTSTDRHAVCFDTTQITSKENGSNPKAGDPCHPLAAGAHAPAVAFSIMPMNSGKDYKAREVDVSQPLMTSQVGGNQGGDYIKQNMQVRRLTPTECERLQGFPDGYTQIPWRNKLADDCPDGPRYKALGNSMAVNVMSWIGQRIDMVDKLLKELA